jgi:segregation and condensation protein B
MPNKADIIESLLFAADKPLSLKKLAQIAELTEAQARAELEVLREEKSRIGSLQIVEVAQGWQIVTKPAFASFIRQLREEKKPKLSRAAFEVLAIVAYRQPVTRGEVEELRGVDCAGSMHQLLDKKLIQLSGRKEAPGRPWLYGTSNSFLDHFGLRSIDDLPSLAEFAALNDTPQQLFSRGAMKSDEEVEATVSEATASEAASKEVEEAGETD